MKNRNGFVSNSSSSSFVLIGRLLDANGFDMKKMVARLNTVEELDKVTSTSYCGTWSTLDEEGKDDVMGYCREFPCAILSGDDDGMPDSKVGVGKLITHSTGEEMDFTCTNVAEIADRLKNAGIEGPIQVITGTMAT